MLTLEFPHKNTDSVHLDSGLTHYLAEHSYPDLSIQTGVYVSFSHVLRTLSF